MKKIVIYLGIFLGITFTGCKDEFLEENPPHLITAESLYEDLEGFETGLNGLYALARGEREGRSDGGANHLRAAMMMEGTDILAPNHVDGFGFVAEGWQDRNNSFHDDVQRQFEWLYQIINSANTLINRAQDTDVVWTGNGKPAEENKNRVLAEARVLRGWAYRHLAYLWGDVPLVTKESFGSNIRTDWERAPVEQVWDQVKRDMLFGQQYISVEPRVPGALTKGVPQHYLSEVYLVLNKPDSSIYWADQVINNLAYELITERYGIKKNQPGVPFMDMFYQGNSNRHEGNNEALWTWQWELETIGGGYNIMRRWHGSRYERWSIGGKTPLEITADRGGRGQARMSLTKYAIDNYEPQDDRGSNYVLRRYYILKNASQNDTGVADELPTGYKYGDTLWTAATKDLSPDNRQGAIYNWPYSRKWEWANPTDITGSFQYDDQVYLRLAETYLLKAEAQLMKGNAAEAAQTLNVIRSRSNASEITAADVDIDFILDERARELLLEEQRRYSLLRTGKWLERVQKYNKNGGQFVVERDQLFPLPQQVIDANLTKVMPQNPGY